MGRYVSAGSVTSPTRVYTLDVYGASGASCTWVVPSGVASATFEIWGGGGAGAPHCCCYCNWGSGGAGGGYALKTIAVTPGASYTVCAGAGGSTVYCSVGGVNQGCGGCTSYVTGTNLSNFCANGGTGGCTCSMGYSSATGLGGLSYGGDVTIAGGYLMTLAYDSKNCALSIGGPSPLGGGFTFMNSMNVQTLLPGCCGVFPGGGGTSSINSTCDCCMCNGQGAPGLVRITY